MVVSACTLRTFHPLNRALAHALYFSFMHGYAEDRSAALGEAFETGRKAVASDERDARLAVRQPTAAVTAYFILAATLGQLGKDEEARKVMADVLRMKPDISANYVAQIFPFRNSADLEYVIEGLHKAGMPH